MANRWGNCGKRRDANEPEIIKALKRVGAEWWQVSGRGLPDLIVRFRGRFFCGEVKTATGRLKPSQGDFPIWRSPDDALREIGALATESGEALNTLQEALSTQAERAS